MALPLDELAGDASEEPLASLDVEEVPKLDLKSGTFESVLDSLDSLDSVEVSPGFCRFSVASLELEELLLELFELLLELSELPELLELPELSDLELELLFDPLEEEEEEVSPPLGLLPASATPAMVIIPLAALDSSSWLPHGKGLDRPENQAVCKRHQAMIAKL